jgi:2-polyprenyl-3-methyl-5-hydroxy-6-metoxy-1,4-benzoquinol methylase
VDPEGLRDHWQGVWQQRTPTEVSWYQPLPDRSLREITLAGVPPATARLIDVGGGASTLVDRLLETGWAHLTVADISSEGLRRAQERLGAEAERVEWVEGDVRDVDLGGPFDVWHDRAVFHFLVEEKDRRAYVTNLERHIAPKGHVILATFAPDGPERCSGLPVMRHDADSLQRELGDGFRLASAAHDLHVTPDGTQQSFTYARFWKRPEGGEAKLSL